jgi:hypothetical protein
MMAKRRDRRRSGGLLDLVVLTDVYDGDCSPCNLTHARSHDELAARKPRPISEGCSFREKLVTDDYWNWE